MQTNTHTSEAEKIARFIERHGFKAVVKGSKVYMSYEYFIPDTGEKGFTYELVSSRREAFKTLGY